MWAVGLLEITAGWEPRGHLGPLGAVGSSLPCGLSSLLYSFPPTWPAAQSHGPGAKRKVETCICGPDAMEVNNLLCLWGLFFYFTINSRLTPKSVTLVLPFSQTSEMSLEFFKWHLHLHTLLSLQTKHAQLNEYMATTYPAVQTRNPGITYIIFLSFILHIQLVTSKTIVMTWVFPTFDSFHSYHHLQAYCKLLSLLPVPCLLLHCLSVSHSTPFTDGISSMKPSLKSSLQSPHHHNHSFL